MDDWFNKFTSVEFSFYYNKKNFKFELYLFAHSKTGGVTYEKVRDEINNDLESSDITASDLQDEIIVPISIEVMKKNVK